MDEAERDAFAERLLGHAIGALELLGVYLGVRLGLYAALADGRAITPGEFASAAGIHPRCLAKGALLVAAGCVKNPGDTEGAISIDDRLDRQHRELLLDTYRLHVRRSKRGS